MRTKTTILTAALIAAGVASSMAQSQVYSLNIVGYIQVSITNYGYSLLTAPLVGSSFNVNTSLTNILDATGLPIQDGTLIQYQTGVGFLNGLIAGTDGTWLNGNFSLATNNVLPGSGFFLQISSGAGNTLPFTMTLTGSVLTGTNSYAIPAGYSFMGNFEPVVEDVCSNSFGAFPVQDASQSDTLQTFNSPAGQYNNAIFAESAANGGPAFLDGNFNVYSFQPSLGQGWLYNNFNLATNWTQIVP